MGLSACLNKVFGGQTMDIIASAVYMVREGGSMDAIDDWLERTLVPGYFKSFNSQSTNRLFESISPSETHEFFRKWVAVVRTG